MTRGAGRMRGVWGIVCACIFAALWACASGQKGPKIGGGSFAEGAPLPDAADVVESYNTRVRDLERLRSPVTLIIDAPDDKGGRDREQVEGLLQVALPSRVALRIDKVGQTIYYLGSNDERYWWFNLGKEKEAFVGTHAQATPEKARRFGLPVHPLDLVELVGATPLPSPSLLTLRWSGEGLVVLVPGRWGTRRLFLDPITYEPRRIEIIDREGVLAVSSRLERSLPVPVDGQAFSQARIASRIEIDVPRADAKVSIGLSEPTNPREKLRMKAFDLLALMEGYGLGGAVDVDALEAPPVAAGNP